MTISSIDCNDGLALLTLSPRRDTRAPRAARRRGQPPKRGRINEFSRKSERRFAEDLTTAAIPWASSAVVTLNFPDAGPREARKELAAFVRLVRKRLPGAFGWSSIEFKASGLLHIHVLLCAPRRTLRQVVALRAELAAKFASLAYIAPMESLRGWLRYMAKRDRQRIVPEKFHGQHFKFWSRFGRVPRRTGPRVELPEVAQEDVRRAVASMVAAQGGERSLPFACAVAASTGKISVRMTRAEAAKFITPLVVLFPTRQRPAGPPAGKTTGTRPQAPHEPRPPRLADNGFHAPTRFLNSTVQRLARSCPEHMRKSV